MTKQVINIGTIANDGTGDPARTAFDKVNQNFTELYNNTSNLDNTADADKPVSTAQSTAIATAKSEAITASENYTDARVSQLELGQGNFDASGNAFPTSSNVLYPTSGGAIKAGYKWRISVAGTPPGFQDLSVGDELRALLDNPSSASDWAAIEGNLGYVPENTSNKSTSTSDSASSIKYPVWSAIVSFFDAARIKSILGITTLSGSNTGDQDLSAYATTATVATKEKDIVLQAPQTSNFTAQVNKFYPIDLTTGNISVTMPSGAADGDRVGFKIITQPSSNALNGTLAGSDVINKAGGSNTFSLSVLNEAIIFKYKSSSSIWVVVTNSNSITQLDSRYQNKILGTISPANAAADTGQQVETAVGNLQGQINYLQSNQIGLLFSDTFQRSSLGSSWTKTGSGTASIVSNELEIAGGSSFNDVLYYNPVKTLLEKGRQTIKYRVGTLNSGGIAIGCYGSTSLYAWLDTTISSASVLKVYNGTVYLNLISNSNPNTLSVSSGDNIQLSMFVSGRNLIITAYNITTGNSITGTVINYYGSTPFNPKFFNYAIASLGGTHYVTSTSQYDYRVKNFQLLTIGDSITYGNASTVVENAWSSRLMDTFERVERYAVSGLQAFEVNNAGVFANLQAMRNTQMVQRILIFLGINDLTQGRTSTQLISDLTNIISTLEGYGYTVDIATLIPRSGNQTDIDTVNAFIYGKASSNKIIDFAKCVTLSMIADGTHPGDAATINMYEEAAGIYSEFLKTIKVQKTTYFENPVSYSTVANANTTLAANISNTDTVIPVTSIAGMLQNAYYSISDGTNKEIVYATGVIDGYLTGVVRALSGTTALTISSSPTNYSVRLITYGRLSAGVFKYFEAQYATNRSFHGWNCDGQKGTQNVYRFTLNGSGNPTFIVDSVVAGVLIQYFKNTSSDSTQLQFGDTAARYQVLHDASNRFIFGRVSGNSPSICVQGTDYVTVNSNNSIYRDQNGSSDSNVRFMVDSANSITAGKGWGVSLTGELIATDANGTRRIKTALLKTNEDVSVPGSEFADLDVYTKPSGGAARRVVRFGKNGGLIVTTGTVLSNSAVDGFIYVPEVSGTPTGTPTSQTGSIPIQIDSTASKIWAYISGSWKSTSLT